MSEATIPGPPWLATYASNFGPTLAHQVSVRANMRRQTIAGLVHAITENDPCLRLGEAELVAALRAGIPRTHPAEIRGDCSAWLGEVGAEVHRLCVEVWRRRAEEAARAAESAEARREEGRVAAERKAIAERSEWEAADREREDAEARKWAAYEREGEAYRRWKESQAEHAA